MQINFLDIFVIAAYFVVLLAVGLLKGRGMRGSASNYFISKGTLPWWVIAAAFVSTGMNTEQLIGQNGMGYTIGLTMVNWYMVVIFVYSMLIFLFLPIYLRNGIVTMPEFMGKRFDDRSRNVFTLLLLASYVLLNLAVVFYGGAKLLEVVMGLNIWYGVIILGVVSHAFQCCVLTVYRYYRRRHFQLLSNDGIISRSADSDSLFDRDTLEKSYTGIGVHNNDHRDSARIMHQVAGAACIQQRHGYGVQPG